MNLMNIMTDTSGLPGNTLTMGGTYGLWDVARNKAIRLSTYIVYSRHVKDSELKKFIDARISIIQKQIKSIHDLFNKRDFALPKTPNWELKIKEEAPVIIPNSILNDEEIILSMREDIRSALSLEAESLRNATMPEARNIIYDIMKKDDKVYSELLELQVKKNWTDFSPVLIQQ